MGNPCALNLKLSGHGSDQTISSPLFLALYISLEAQLLTYWVPVLKSLYNDIICNSRTYYMGTWASRVLQGEASTVVARYNLYNHEAQCDT